MVSDVLVHHERDHRRRHNPQKVGHQSFVKPARSLARVRPPDTVDHAAVLEVLVLQPSSDNLENMFDRAEMQS